MLTNVDIIEYIKHKKHLNKYFDGIVRIDEMKYLQDNHFYILFIAKKDKYLGHWSFICKKNNTYYYFSSFGELLDIRLLDYINKNAYYNDKNIPYTNTICQNKEQIQSLDSVLCGYYVLFVLNNFYQSNLTIEKFQFIHKFNIKSATNKDIFKGNYNILKQYF